MESWSAKLSIFGFIFLPLISALLFLCFLFNWKGENHSKDKISAFLDGAITFCWQFDEFALWKSDLKSFRLEIRIGKRDMHSRYNRNQPTCHHSSRNSMKKEFSDPIYICNWQFQLNCSMVFSFASKLDTKSFSTSNLINLQQCSCCCRYLYICRADKIATEQNT